MSAFGDMVAVPGKRGIPLNTEKSRYVQKVLPGVLKPRRWCYQHTDSSSKTINNHTERNKIQVLGAMYHTQKKGVSGTRQNAPRNLPSMRTEHN